MSRRGTCRAFKAKWRWAYNPTWQHGPMSLSLGTPRVDRSLPCLRIGYTSMPNIDLTAAPHTKSDLDSILQSTQGHILEKHRRDHVWNVLLTFTPGSEIASLIGGMPCTIPSAADLRNEGNAI